MAGDATRAASATRRRGDRKAQLTGVAAELFRRHGYHAVGIGDIAAAAGITGPAVYRHFASKQDILAHVLLSGVDALRETVDRVLDAPGAPETRLRQLTDAFARLAVARRDAIALWRWLGRHLEPDLRAEVRRRGEALTGRWTAELCRTRPGLRPGDADLLCRAAMGVFGSPANYSVTLGKARHAELLRDLATAVLECPLPESGSGEAPGAPRDAASVAGVDGHRAAGGDESGGVRGGIPGASRREVLLGQATRLFWERGYHAVTMEDIGAAAGIAGPSVYRHFASKADLLRAAASRMLDRLTAGAARAVSGAPDPRQALDRLIESYAETVLAHRDLMAVYVAEVSSLPEEDRAELQRLQRGYVAEWVRLVAAAEPGLTPPEARVVAHAALTLATDLARTGRLRSRRALTTEIACLMRAVTRAVPGMAAGPGSG